MEKEGHKTSYPITTSIAPLPGGKPQICRCVSPMEFWSGVTFLPGDFGSLTQLFFDNLSTTLGVLFYIFNMENFGVPRDVINNIVYGRIIPGIGVTLALGNVFYTWQSIREGRARGKQLTAQPYGLNTPAAFAFVFNIFYPVYFGGQGTPTENFTNAYYVTLAANFIAGLVSFFLGFVGPWILKTVPPAALLTPMAGIGFTFLGIEQMSTGLGAPIIGFSTVFVMFLGWYSYVRMGAFGIRCPEALQVILVGVILGWATGYNKKQDVKDAVKLVQWYGPEWSAKDLFSNFSQVKDYLGVVIPISINASASTLMCLVSAKAAGEPYPVMESMCFDGLGTMAVAMFGSPFGTVVYIGHPAHKRSGARTGYSFMNGWLYLLLSWFGMFALMRSIVNQPTIGPIVLFVGLMINAEALEFVAARHIPAYIIGLFPALCDWMVNISDRAPLSNIPETYNTNLPFPADGFYGILGFKYGSILISMLWVAMIVYIIDRQWVRATAWAFTSAVCAMFGIIHMPTAGLNHFDNAVWQMCSPVSSTTSTSDASCWTENLQWKYMTAYLMLAATFGLIEVCRRSGHFPTLQAAIEDEKMDVFQNWYDVPEDSVFELDSVIVLDSFRENADGSIVMIKENHPGLRTDAKSVAEFQNSVAQLAGASVSKKAAVHESWSAGAAHGGDEVAPPSQV